MRYLLMPMLAGAMALLAHNADAADDKMTIAVFTKNSTNPAYEAFRIAADQIARTTGAKGCISCRSSLTISTSRRRWWIR